MSFLKRFAEGFAFTAFVLIAIVAPVIGLFFVAAHISIAYGPTASMATLFFGICALVGVAAAVFD